MAMSGVPEHSITCIPLGLVAVYCIVHWTPKKSRKCIRKFEHHLMLVSLPVMEMEYVLTDIGQGNEGLPFKPSFTSMIS